MYLPVSKIMLPPDVTVGLLLDAVAFAAFEEEEGGGGGGEVALAFLVEAEEVTLATLVDTDTTEVVAGMTTEYLAVVVETL